MMLNETYRAMLGNKSVIRETFMYGKKRAAEIGYENVFDYSLGITWPTPWPAAAGKTACACWNWA